MIDNIHTNKEQLDKEWVELELLSAKCDVFLKLINEVDVNGNKKYPDKDWLKKQIFGDIIKK